MESCNLLSRFLWKNSGADFELQSFEKLVQSSVFCGLTNREFASARVLSRREEIWIPCVGEPNVHPLASAVTERKQQVLTIAFKATRDCQVLVNTP